MPLHRLLRLLDVRLAVQVREDLGVAQGLRRLPTEAAVLFPQSPDLVGDGRVRRDDGSTVAEGPEVLAGEEREAGGVADRADRSPALRGQMIRDIG